jgi:hypothetical protein
MSVLSCSSTSIERPAPAPPAPPPEIRPPLLAPCAPMPLATDSRVPHLLGIHDRRMVVADDCAKRHMALADAVRAQQLIAWDWYCKAAQAAGVRVDGCPERAR